MNESVRPYEGVADDTFAIAFLTKSSDGDAGLFAAHDEIGVMLGHGSNIIIK